MAGLATTVAVAACVIAIVLADLRWLRVAQREHYLFGSTSSFVSRWWFGRKANISLFSIAFAGIVLSSILPEAAVIAAGPVALGPLGLGVRGRTSPLVWTRRLKTLALVVVTLQALGILLGVVSGSVALAAALMAALSPTFVDAGLLITGSWEKRQIATFVDQARRRLRDVSPTVVAITGSYGKTSTKGYIAHLLGSTRTVLATPASFNNRAGLSRAVNEHLVPGTDVFIAEMGTYGAGEIAELCEIATPEIAVLTAIGPVHLERFGSEEAILRAKVEIFDKANVCVLNVDDERLAKEATRLAAAGKTVWRCSSQAEESDVRVVVEAGEMIVVHLREIIASAPEPNASPTNVACAVAVALELGVGDVDLSGLLANLPVAPHRQEITKTAKGVVVIDDTYNANPASVQRGLELLERLGRGEGGRRAVVTPGMVELGQMQAVANEEFARGAALSATDLVVVGHTNRKALLDGSRGTSLNVVTVDELPEAVQWVRSNLETDDAVFYANDLPDHFP